MSDKKLEDAEELKAWLIGKGVDADDAAEAADKFLLKGFNKPSRLLGITVEELKTDVGIANPLARELSNKLKEQQQDGKLRWCFRIHCAGRTSIRVCTSDHSFSSHQRLSS